MLLEYKAFSSEFKAEGDQGQYKGHFSIFGNVDDGMDVVHPGTFKRTLEARKNRIKVFYAHDWEKLIGPPPSLIVEDEVGLYAEGRLTLDSFWGRETWALMKDQALTEGSFGYRTVRADWAENGVRHIYDVDLFEISPVPLGMNPLTSVQAAKALLRSMPASFKRAIPPHTTEMAPEDEPWDGAAVLREVEGREQLRLIHAWVDAEGDAEVKASYKLPHHLPDGRVVWNGVMAAGNALMGGRGGVAIPDDDVAGVQRHLARHYEQFEKIPPWEDDDEDAVDWAAWAQKATLMTEALKAGRVLSAASRTQVQGALDALSAAVDALSGLLAHSDGDDEAGFVAAQARLRERARAVGLVLAKI